MIAGIADSDIRKELLSIPDLIDKTDKEIVELVAFRAPGNQSLWSI